jgi:threonine dehydratase
MNIPTLDEIKETRRLIDPYIVETPVWRWRNRHVVDALGPETDVFLKLELFQHTGTFKPRGALRVMLDLDQVALDRGVTAVSAGNHAIAVGYAAQQLGSTAKVLMPQSADPARIATCRTYGTEVILVQDVHAAFDRVHRIEAEEKRTFVHPFEGPLTALGTATVGLELCRQVPDLDAVIVPIGGGGLCAGIATAVKLLQPQCLVFGVEPEGADTMHRSFASGRPQSIDRVRTIADSLGAPYAAPYSFNLCHHFVDELVLVSDDDLRSAMLRIYQGVKLAAEPAGAAATAALVGPLCDRLRGKRVAVILCGSNIDPTSLASHLAAAKG